MNDFYKQPLFLQWLEAIVLLIIGFYPAIVIIELTYNHFIYSLLFLIYLPLGQFSLTPIFKLSGVYNYYSPMLLGYMTNNQQIDLHSGGSFDYLFVMRKFKAGIESRNRIFIYHLEGLLSIIKQIEEGHIPKSVVISGTSYFFNERTIERLGFDYETPSLFYRINLLVNFIDLTWMYSVSRGKFSFPNVLKARKASIKGEKLVEKKEMLSELHKNIAIRLKK